MPFAVQTRARSLPAAVVLQAAVDVVGPLVVHRDAVVLRHRQVLHVEELQSAIERDADAAVVQLDDVARVLRIDPHEAIVAVRGRVRRRERFAAVVGERVLVEHVDAAIVLRIDRRLARIHRPRIPVRHEPPGLAGVVAAIQAAAPLGVGRRRVVAEALLDAGDHDARILAIHRDADASVLAFRQAVAGQLRPRGAGVGALPQRAAGAAAVEAERGSAPLIRRGIQHVRIERIHRHIGDAGVVVHMQRALPRLAAVHRAIQPAIAARSPHRSLRRHVDDRRIRRVSDDAADVHRGLEADVGPRLARRRCVL